MTGYGSSKYSNEGLIINVEVKTLNSKYLDLNLRVPKAFNEKELEIRNLVNSTLERGKVSLSIDFANESLAEQKQTYNEELFVKYYNDLKKLANKVIASDGDLFRIALSSPDVIVNTGEQGLDSNQWDLIRSQVVNALDQCNEFRNKEGAIIEEKFRSYTSIIKENLQAVEKLDPNRVERIKDRIKGNLMEFVEEEGLDKNRLEQELVYYIEKLDITEEKVRLSNHLDHFSEVLDDEKSLGKKLGFISQEIGREINTIGSKANDSEIQKHVVNMKEELEKIKEQVLNIL